MHGRKGIMPMNLPIKRSGRAFEDRMQRRRYPAGLTERQVEVLRLVATGMTNPEIAEELVISLHTVTNHITNHLTKIGASNRVQASMYAVERDLMD